MNDHRNDPRATKHALRRAPDQLNLFEAELMKPTEVSMQIDCPSMATAVRSEDPELHVARNHKSRVVTTDDMPAYPAEAVAAARNAIAQLPAAQLWFTYKDLRFFFGVSRATVARRLSEALVPGVRMLGASVVEDAAVRRFDREQVHWLLLAVRHRERREVSPLT
jgi:hypothetical protein